MKRQAFVYDNEYIIFQTGHWYYPAYMPANRRGVLSLCEVLYLSRGKAIRCSTYRNARAVLLLVKRGSLVVKHGSFVKLPANYVRQLLGKACYRNNINGYNPHSKLLTWEAVRQIRARYARGGISHSQLADEYGCSKTTVTLILQRKVWRDDEQAYHGSRSGS